MTVRLVVDDLASFGRLEPAIDTSGGVQEINGVTVIRWDKVLELCPAAFVIEAFAVNLPEPYVAAMATSVASPVWINLEYLSAELWVGEHHLLPSPHPQLPLTKYFFFPGFMPDTGGLIRERNLLTARDAFASSNQASTLKVFLFGYGNSAGGNLIRAMSESETRVRCTVPEGTLSAMLKSAGGAPERRYDRMVETIPFCAQHAFDHLLWRHDVLFVRGEDSLVRALWAAKPLVWQIYPQSEEAHWPKLNAFLKLYCEGLENEAALAMRELWRAWNAEDCANIGTAWRRFVDHLPTLQAHAKSWSTKLARMPDLAANLLSFYQKTTKI